MMRYFPVYLDMENKLVVVVGGGEQAAQKARLLVKTPARIRIVSDNVCAELKAMAEAGTLEIEQGPFRAQHLDGAALTYVASSDPDCLTMVRDAARARNVPVNAVDRTDACDFLTPSLVERGPLNVAIGTEGTAPVLARDIRRHLEARLPARIGEVARQAADLRARVMRCVDNATARRRLWENLLRGAWRKAVLVGDGEGAEIAVQTEIERANRPPQGHITLVGAGPGDPDLLTLKAQHALQAADIIVYDRLVATEILEHARRDAERVYVGKEPHGAATPQAEIDGLIVREALRGQHVVRLKGGDPLIFARATEELQAARAAGISVDIVPGITAAHACAARIALPVTTREKRRSFTVLTAMTAACDTANDCANHDWQRLARPDVAFAIYMGVAAAPKLARKLRRAGAAPTTSVVIVENGTRTDERAFHTTLADLESCLAGEAVRGPAIIFVGLDWASAGLTRPQAVRVFASGVERQAVACRTPLCAGQIPATPDAPRLCATS